MSPWKVALIRGFGSAVVTGALAFLGIWTQSDDVKILVTAGMVPFLTTLSLRFGLEGSWDTIKTTLNSPGN